MAGNGYRNRAPGGRKVWGWLVWCPGCGCYQPRNEFGNSSSQVRPHGVYPICKKCERKRNAARREKLKTIQRAIPWQKECRTCGKVLNNKWFYRDPGKTDGLHSSCIRCINEARERRRKWVGDLK